jgi:hypothetical protein
VTDLATNPQGGDASVSTASEAASTAQEGDASTELPLDAENEADDSSGDDTAEIEHEGQTYRVPKALKGAFLMHADYTRKTQDVAEQRRAVAERDQSLQRRAQAHYEHLGEVGRVLAQNESLAPYEQIDWQGLRISNPQQAQALWSQYVQLRMERDAALAQLQGKLAHWQQADAADTARRVSESRAVLSRDIKEWSPELYGKLKEFGMREFGFTPDEVESTIDPRLIKVLHRAMTGDQMMKTAAAAARAADQDGVKPLPQVGNSASATRWDPAHRVSDKASTAEWMKRRTEQVRRAR